MVIEKFGALALYAISKATGIVALLAAPALRIDAEAGKATPSREAGALRTRLAQSDAITIPASRLGTAGEWDRLTRISEAAWKTTDNATAYQVEAGRALALAETEFAEMREALVSIRKR